ELFVLVVTNQDCAEMFARALWRRVSPNDEFLFVDTFELDPCATSAAGFVNGVTLFADDTFKTAALHFFEKSICVAANRAGTTNRFACADAEFFKNVLPRLQWQ